MRWLVGPAIASLVGAFLVVRIFDYIVAGVSTGKTGGAVESAARAGLFVATWTAIIAGSGMRGFSARVRQLRQKTRSANKLLDTRR